MKRPFLKFILILAIAFLIRILLVNWTLDYGTNGDFSRYQDWARVAHIYNFADTYNTDHLSVWKSTPNNQPPGTLYILSSAYESWILAGKMITKFTHQAPGTNIWVNTKLQHVFIKAPFLIADILAGIFVYFLVTKVSDRKRGVVASALVLLNPVIIYNSAIWGQTDSLNNLFFLISLFFAFRKKTILSILFFATSLYVKLSLLPLLPFYLVFLYLYSGKKIKSMLIGSAISITGIVLATIPTSSQPLQWLLEKFPLIAGGELQNVTVKAFNFWFATTCPPYNCHIPLVSDTLLGIPFSYLAYILFALFSLPLLYLQLKYPKKFIKPENIFLLFALVALLAFLFLPGMHDRYMYPVFPMLGIAVALRKNRLFYLVILGLLTLFNLDNIIYSWFPIVFDSTTTFYHIFYGPVLRWIISILTILTAGIFYIKSPSNWPKIWKVSKS